MRMKNYLPFGIGRVISSLSLLILLQSRIEDLHGESRGGRGVEGLCARVETRTEASVEEFKNA